MTLSQSFLDSLLIENRNRELYVRIGLLTWNESLEKYVEGVVTSGDVSIDSNSSIRRSLSLSFAIDPDSTNTIVSDLNLRKKIKVDIGLKNNVNNPSVTDDIIWFPLGVFVPIDISYTKNISESIISISAQDKMVLLNGDISGQIGADATFYRGITGEEITYLDILKSAIGYFGGIPKEKIIISGIPESVTSYAKVITKNTFYINSSTKKTFDDNGELYTETSSGVSSRVLNADDIISLTKLATPKNTTGSILELSPTDTVTSIIDKAIDDFPAEFVYYFDIDGNFILKEKPYAKDIISITKDISITSGSNIVTTQSTSGLLVGQIISNLSQVPAGTCISSIDSNGTSFTMSNPASSSGTFNGVVFLRTIQENRSDKYDGIFYNPQGITTYNLSDKNVIISLSENPILKGIKNDFYVYGKKDGDDILYHLIIDEIPHPDEIVSGKYRFYKQNSDGTWDQAQKEDYNQPFQQYIIDMVEFYKQTNIKESSYDKYSQYYDELKARFQYKNDSDNNGIYKKTSATTGIWRSESNASNSFIANTTTGSKTLSNVDFNSFLFLYSNLEADFISASFTSQYTGGGIYRVTAQFSAQTDISFLKPDTYFSITIGEDQYQYVVSYLNETLKTISFYSTFSIVGQFSISALSIKGLKISNEAFDSDTIVEDFNILNSEIYLNKTAKKTLSDSIFSIESKNNFRPSRPSGNPLSWNYFFDFANSEKLQKFSVSNIGRRVKTKEKNDVVQSIAPIEFAYPTDRANPIIKYTNMEKTLLEIKKINVDANGTTVTATVIDGDVSNFIVGVDKVVIRNAYGDYSALNNKYCVVTAKNSANGTITFTIPTSMPSNVYIFGNVRTGLKSSATSKTAIAIPTGTSGNYKVGMFLTASGFVEDGTRIVAKSSTHISINKPVLKDITTSTEVTLSGPDFYHFKIDEFQKNNLKNEEIKNTLVSNGKNPICLLESQLSLFFDASDFQIQGNAYDIIKDFVHLHTNFNDGISFDMIPLYFLDVDSKVNIFNYMTDQNEDYYVTSMTIPLSYDGVASMTGIKSY